MFSFFTCFTLFHDFFIRLTAYFFFSFLLILGLARLVRPIAAEKALAEDGDLTWITAASLPFEFDGGS